MKTVEIEKLPRHAEHRVQLVRADPTEKVYKNSSHVYVILPCL